MITARARGPQLTFKATCLSTDARGDLVYVAGPGKQVTKADPTNPTYYQRPAIGCISRKVNATHCVVQVAGVIDGYDGLSPGSQCWVGTDGRPTTTRPSPAIGEICFQHRIGFAVDSDAMSLEPNTLLEFEEG